MLVVVNVASYVALTNIRERRNRNRGLKGVNVVEPLEFDFDYEEDGSLSLESAVFQALGAASVCWEDMRGTGVFQSDRAKAIGDRLVQFILQEGPTEVVDEPWHGGANWGAVV